MVKVEFAAIPAVSEGDPQIRFDQLTREVEQLRAENQCLRTLLALAQQTRTILTSKDERRGVAAGRRAPVEMDSDAAENVALVRSLFRGRDDVYALRWESARTGESGYAPAVAGGWRGSKDAQRRHLPAALERSRSGNGGHLWVFFTKPVPAASARRLGALALRKTMACRAELDLMSYDRLFPNQDILPQRGFDNLIALPCRDTPSRRHERLSRAAGALADA